MLQSFIGILLVYIWFKLVYSSLAEKIHSIYSLIDLVIINVATAFLALIIFYLRQTVLYIFPLLRTFFLFPRQVSIFH